MAKAGSLGFTLIELLTVIAIIAILASMVLVVGPRMIERAKITSYTSTCNSIRTACVAYYTKNHDSYPPAYGYRKPNVQEASTTDETDRFFLEPYMARLGMFRNFDAYDRFSQDTYDTDKDGNISLLEYSPIGVKSAENQNKYNFPVFRYVMNPNQLVNPLNPGRTFADEIREAKQQQRPLVYVPINTKQYQKVAQHYYEMAKKQGTERQGWYMERWDLGNIAIPTKYDDYILISVGPASDTGGILTAPTQFLSDLQSQVDPDLWYHVMAIRAYWLATRDANDNQQLDFDYRNRTRGTEGKPTSYSNPGLNLNLLPNGTNGAGCLIYRPNS